MFTNIFELICACRVSNKVRIFNNKISRPFIINVNNNFREFHFYSNRANILFTHRLISVLFNNIGTFRQVKNSTHEKRADT